MLTRFIFYVSAAFTVLNVHAQPEANYEESKVPDYILPELLITQDGRKIKSPEEWFRLRRPEIMMQFEYQEYGKIPEAEVRVSFEMLEIKENVLNGLANRKQVKITFSNGSKEHAATLLLYIPAHAAKSSPLFLAYNFHGNHTIYPDTEILISPNWSRNNPNINIFGNKLDERSRGARTNRWPVNQILQRGYGLAVMYYGDIDPDFDDGFQNGIHPLFYAPGQNKPEQDEWGSIGAWAYGLSKIMDYLQLDVDVDHEKVAVLGHSRLGKAALWAGAFDDRFAMVISNESGCGGAALSKREFGERIGRINHSFPHWFCDNFNIYNENEDGLPFDQHMLVALIAPRPVYIASAVQDQWADPKGEFLSGFYASEVYRLFGLKGITSDEMPEPNQPIKTGQVGYHIRSGEHDLTYYDWEQFMDFADQHLKED